MFLFTMTKPGLRQAGALALCGVCLAGAITAAVHFTGGTVTAGADASTTARKPRWTDCWPLGCSPQPSRPI